MQYFTAAEADAILGCTSLRLCVGDESNPNRDAFLKAVWWARHMGGIYTAVAMGFLLGQATGKREERARRKERNGEE